MRLLLPPVFGVDEKFSKGVIKQLLEPSSAIEVRMTRFVLPSAAGWMFTDDGGDILYVFPRPPLADHIPADGRVVIGTVLEDVEEIDLRDGKWLRHGAQVPGNVSSAVRESWRKAFKYIGEDEAGDGRIGLRKPQLGALHAIHAHWSTSQGVATVVMPTGTGKTETMLATLVTALCSRLLVLVPTDALRSQITDKFLTLGILKHENAVVLDSSALRPVVGTLLRRPDTPEEVDALFNRCNVIVTTSVLAGRCGEAVQQRMADLCSHLFIDEAHHAEAPTWKRFKAQFKTRDRAILQFTATPFREDGIPLDGKIVYVYPLRMAQRDNYFRPIQFRPVYAYKSARADQEIATKVIEELAADPTGKHVAMARVADTARADEVLEIYRALGQYNPVKLHSRMPKGELDRARQILTNRQTRIVVCVDMLGEGFDMPELKIAAFHDLRKSLAITLQLAGRFTRAREDLGNAVFIANTADVNLREELRTLYSQDPDWNLLLPQLSDGTIEKEVEAQEFLAGFEGELDEIPLSEIHPAASMVVYRTQCQNWNPSQYRKAFRGGAYDERIYPILNEAERTLVVIAARRQGVAWTGIPAVESIVWELCIAVWDSERSLLYIHGSTNSGTYSDFAKALCGNNVSLITAPEVFRVFSGINRLMLTNVGLDEQIGRQIRYTGRMGPDVGSRLSEATLGTTTKAVLAGVGFERGGHTSVGAGKKGRVWSNLRLRVNAFTEWCKRTGAKMVDEAIDPEEVLRGTLIPKLVSARPTAVVVGVDWPVELLDFVESATTISFSATHQEPLTNVSVELVECSDTAPLALRVFTDSHEVRLKLNFVGRGANADFQFVYEGESRATIRRGKTFDLCEYFTEFPPTFWFADGSRLDGNMHTELRTGAALYSRERLEVIDWTDVDIRKESQGEERNKDTVQYRAIEVLKAAFQYEVLMDDDGSGEAADVVGIRTDNPAAPRLITIDLVHCKFSQRETPGARIDDMYVVCGQAQRSVMWLHNKERRTDLLVHLLRREGARIEAGRSTRIEVGTVERLMQLRDISRTCTVTLRVFIVQPGLSKSTAAEHQLAVLGVTEKFLTETYQIPLHVYCGDVPQAPATPRSRGSNMASPLSEATLS
ncbi:DEAD/DEAH box helicase [Cupriavidus taiwanensis]|uniref:DEAD/DEAH box helicase n=1 Tax=Cupriavidus taiwanensis TaxID=164546 RepID=UPI000E187136|nr:DEAD/DEAH box helicase family protein [Cupriavidus taiwanensis]SOY43621.1 Type III restriction enzyme, res subunit [Cupriavidus taiwanensis]